MYRDGLAALGPQWEGTGEHSVSRVGDQYEVQARQRKLLHIAERRDELFKDAPVVTLDPKKVLPTQQFVFRGKHEDISKAPAADLPPVDVVQHGRSNYVLDGHHRWSVAKQAGQPLRARVVKYAPGT